MNGSEAAARRARALHPDEETRYRAVADLDPADAGERAALVERLADPSWRVRSAAAEAIARAPGASAIEALVGVLAGGPEAGAREAAAAALGRAGAAAVPPLVERLASHDPDLWQAAASVLAAIGDERAVPPLTAGLAHRDPNVRAAAAAALGRIGGRDAVEALRAAAGSDDPTSRLAAIDALGSLPAALPVERVEALLAERPLRRALYRMLGASDDPRALAIVARGASDPSRAGREAALGALGRQRGRLDGDRLAPAVAELAAAAAGDAGLADAWADALASDEPFVAIGALTAVVAAGAARHAGRVARLAEDECHGALVEDALDRLPAGAELRAALAAALPALGQLSRVTALAALARLGSPAALESVVREASDPDSYVQRESIAALGRLRDLRAVPPLAGLLAEDVAAAEAAAGALVCIGKAGAVEREAVLAAARGRADASPAPALYRVIGALGEQRDVALVLAGLRAPGVAERAAAANASRALARRGVLGDAGVCELVGALSDPAAGVRAAAARAVTEVARARAPGAALVPDPGAALREALRDAEASVRAAAAEALGACGRVDEAPEVAALVHAPDPAPLVLVAALHALVALGRVSSREIAIAVGHGDPEVVKEAVLCAARLPGDEGARILRSAAASARWDVRRAAARAMAERNDPELRTEAERLAGSDPDPLVARAFSDAARTLGGR